jgi:hypothetical protein
MNQVQKVTNETIRNGGVLALLYFDIHTKTKDLAQEVGAGFVNDLLKYNGVVYAVGEIDEPLESKEGDSMFSTSVQVKVLTRKFGQLMLICATFSPFTVEILQPNEIRLPLNEAHELLGTIGAITLDYKKFIVEKIKTPAESKQYTELLSRRAALGKQILSRKSASEEAKKPAAEEAKK